MQTKEEEEKKKLFKWEFLQLYQN